MKTKIAHTPGPWEVDKKDGGLSIRKANQNHYIAIAGFQLDDSERANANLIAAAPDLLEALKSLLSIEENRFSDLVGNPEFPKFTARIEHARAAIAKAEGE